MVFWQIILGLFTAGFLIFLRNANLKAQKQKIIAIRLHSYLLYWKKFVLDNHWLGIFYMGMKWNEEIDKIIKKGQGTEALIKLKDDKKKKIDELKEEMLKESGKVKVQQAIDEMLRKSPPNAIDHMLQYVQKTGQNLVDGKTFISDEDASNLGVFIAQTTIELKMDLISMLNSVMNIIVMLSSNPEKFELKDYVDDIAKLVWKGIVVSKNIDTLSKKTDFFNQLSTFDLTMRNLRDEL